MDVVLRPMRVEDVDAVWAMERRLFGADSWSRTVLEQEVRSRLRYYVVVERVEDGQREIIAYAGLLVVPPSADIQTIGVVAEHEGRGLGALMLRELIAEAENRGAESILLEVRHDNGRAQKLYRWFGFEVVDTRKHYYSSGNDATVMRKNLGRASKGLRSLRSPGRGEVGPVGSEALRKNKLL